MKKSTYLFHFIVSETMKNYINYLKKSLGFKRDTMLYDYMLTIMSKNLPQLKGILGDHHSEYALIDLPNIPRVNKYARLKENNYKIIKKWHNDFNEYGMSTILREIIKLFYDGIIEHGVEKFIEMISGKLDIKRISRDVKDILTHLIRFSEKKAVLFLFIAKNIANYT